MRNYLVIFSLILMVSCHDDAGLNVSSLKNQFSVRNPGTIDFTNDLKEKLTKIEDTELIRLLFTLPGVDIEITDDILEYESFYYHAWIENHGFSGFTVLRYSDSCENYIYFFSTESSSIAKSGEIVAAELSCADFAETTKAKFVNDSTLLVSSRGGTGYEPAPTISENKLTVGKDGVIKSEKRTLQQSVCLWEKLTIKDGPSTKAKYLTSITLGEVIIELGKSKKDSETSEEHEYTEVRLSDDTEGWVQSRFLGRNAAAGVATGRTRIYERADLLTGTDMYFERFDILALHKMEDSDGQTMWYKVKGKPAGEKWFKEGWVPYENISQSPADITVASLTKNALLLKKSEQKEALMRIVENEDLESSALFGHVRNMAGVEIEIDRAFAQKLSSFPKITLPIVLDRDTDIEDEELSESLQYDWLGLNNAETIYPIGWFELNGVIGVIINDNYVGTWAKSLLLFTPSGENIASSTLNEESWMEGATRAIRSRIDANGSIRMETNNFEYDEDNELTADDYVLTMLKIDIDGITKQSEEEVFVKDCEFFEPYVEN